MCGLTGILTNNSIESLQSDCSAMTEILRKRGPDDQGVWVDKNKGITLGHTRLAVIDLSKSGRQPMMSNNGRWVLVYNGEIYNHIEIRKELISLGINFRGDSDTETLLEAIATWGVENTVSKLIGMFAFAVWDSKLNLLSLVRDRMGIKPLYYGNFNGLFLFGSELKALRAHKGWSPCINRDALASFMRHNYVPAPMSIYQNVFKLEAGCILKVRLGEEPKINSYWSLSNIVQRASYNRIDFNDFEATNKLNELLLDAVGRRMISDVPLGAFLSGGIDSSLVVALMQAQSSSPINTFTIGFEESNYNEAEHAAIIAKHLKTNHSELYVSSDDALNVIPKLPDIYDEPFSDSSQIPTFLVSELARQHVTVALSGDGGDECFAGYDRYFLAERIQRSRKRLPDSFLNGLSLMINSIKSGRLRAFSNAMPTCLTDSKFGEKIRKIPDILLQNDDELYRYLLSHWKNPNELVLNSEEKKGAIWDEAIQGFLPEYIERMEYLDYHTYLPDDILTKIDRASMANSLEARVPLIDHRVVEFSWQLPLKFKIRNGKSKWLMRQVLQKYVPQELFERPKMGFGVPLDNWLRGPLREWADSLLNENRIRQEGYLNSKLISKKWQEHLSGKKNWQYYLWDILVFQAWHERWM